MRLDTGTKGTYQSAAKRRVGKGPGGRARRTQKSVKPKTTEDNTDWFNYGKEQDKKHSQESYKKHLGPRGRASRPGAKKLKGKAGSMDYDYKRSWADITRDSQKAEAPKMTLKPKTKKGKIKTMPNWKHKTNAKYWIANHTV